MAVLSVTVPNADMPEVLAAIEKRWKPEAIKLMGDEAAYDALTGNQKMQANLRVILRTYVRNERRAAAEQAIVVPNVDVS